jgi:hypothetical protein
MQARGFLPQKIYRWEQIETVEQSPASGEGVREQLRLCAQEATKLSQNARFASADLLLRYFQSDRHRLLPRTVPKQLPNKRLILHCKLLQRLRHKLVDSFVVLQPLTGHCY